MACGILADAVARCCATGRCNVALASVGKDSRLVSAFIPFVAASVAGDIGALIAQVIFAFALLLTAIWGQISQGNRALKMGQDIAFGFFALFIWFIGVAQMISGQVGGLALVIVTILMGTALFDP